MTNLWSLHSSGFSLTSGKVDHSKSEYYSDTPGVAAAYRELWSKIGQPDGQIVWCYTARTNLPKTGIRKTLWCLDVPEHFILRRIDERVWRKIFEREAVQPPTGLRRGRNCETVTGDLWDELFVSHTTPALHRTALIRHPLRGEWVTETVDWVVRNPETLR